MIVVEATQSFPYTSAPVCRFVSHIPVVRSASRRQSWHPSASEWRASHPAVHPLVVAVLELYDHCHGTSEHHNAISSWLDECCEEDQGDPYGNTDDRRRQSDVFHLRLLSKASTQLWLWWTLIGHIIQPCDDYEVKSEWKNARWESVMGAANNEASYRRANS